MVAVRALAVLWTLTAAGLEAVVTIVWTRSGEAFLAEALQWVELVAVGTCPVDAQSPSCALCIL